LAQVQALAAEALAAEVFFEGSSRKQ